MALVPLNPPAAPQSLAQRTTWTQRTGWGTNWGRRTGLRGTAWNGSAALKYWHLASLDAPTVAVTWAFALAWAAQVRLAAFAAALLGLVVWTIYVVDRLLDARAGLDDPGRHPLQERHWFHWRHRRGLGILAGLATLAAGTIIVWRLSAPALERDSVIGLATLAYFSGVHGLGARRREPGSWLDRMRSQAGRVISRELIVGLIFGAGCILPVLPMADSGGWHPYAALAPVAVAFAALAWLNVRAIGCWESAQGKVSRMAIALAAACLVCGVAVGFERPRSAMVLASIAASALLLALLDGMTQRMNAITLRATADVVLLVPLLPMVAEHMLR